MTNIFGAILGLDNSPATWIVVKATIAVALALIVVRLTRGSRAAVRHAVLAASFAVLLVLPLASTLAPPVRLALPVVAARNVPSRVVGVPDVDTISPPLPAGSGVAFVSRQASGVSMAALLYTAWIAGVTLFLLPVRRGMRQIRSLRRSGLPWRHGQSVADTLAFDAGIRRRVEVLLHQSLAGPMTCGVLHPAIVLPPDARGWDSEDLNRALVHELEHVRRGDWATHCLSRVVCALYWFHPLVWIASRQLALEAERSCDDAVLGGSEATAYADQLVGLAQRLSKSPALAMANRADLATRVGAVLDNQQRRGRAGRILVAIACTAAVALVIAVSPLRIVSAQAAEGHSAFEVASVKPSDPQGSKMGTGLSTYPGGRIVASNSTLQLLMMYAFDTELFQFPNAPGWVNDDRFRFDVEARPPASSASSKANPPYPKAPPNDEQREMLRTLLVERFGLKYHRETKEAPVYLLERGSGKLDLHEPKDKEAYPWAGYFRDDGPLLLSGIAGIDISMPQLANRLTSFMGRPVVDKTGLAGSFDFKFSGGPDDRGNDVISTILSSLPAVGLKLEPAKGQVETVVIDHAEKPTLN